MDTHFTQIHCRRCKVIGLLTSLWSNNLREDWWNGAIGFRWSLHWWSETKSFRYFRACLLLSIPSLTKSKRMKDESATTTFISFSHREWTYGQQHCAKQNRKLVVSDQRCRRRLKPGAVPSVFLNGIAVWSQRSGYMTLQHRQWSACPSTIVWRARVDSEWLDGTRHSLCEDYLSSI